MFRLITFPIRLLGTLLILALIGGVIWWLYAKPDLAAELQQYYPSLSGESREVVQCVVARAWSDNPNIEELISGGNASTINFDIAQYIDECKN